MPAFTFEKISPPVRRNPAPVAPAAEEKQRGRIVQILDRLTDSRAKLSLRKTRADQTDRDKPPG